MNTSLLKRLGITALTFSVAAVACAAAIHQLVGNPLDLYAEYRTEKLLILAEHADDANVAVFGSSHLHNGFDPRAFDAALAMPGMRSLNMAIKGGSHVEQALMAKAFLNAKRTKPDQRCVVVLELNAGANFLNFHLTHPRAINAYSPESVALALSFADESVDTARRLGRASYAFAAGAMHLANVGMLSSHIFPPPINRQELAQQTRYDRRGLAVEPVNFQEAGLAAQYLTRAQPARLPQEASLSNGLQQLIQKLEAVPHTCSPQFFFMVSPKASDIESPESFPTTIQVGTRQVPVLNMATPASYPALYQPRMWHDVTHLNEDGAGAMSTELAAAIKPYLVKN
jgi:hypothetical protein